MGEGKAFGGLGNAHQSLGDYKTALDYHKRHLKIAKELGLKSEEGNAYGNLGIVHRRLGGFKRAIDYHERHLKIAKELGDKSGEGKGYGNLGNAHQSRGDYKTAADCHERHLKIAKELEDKWGEGKAYGNLGNVHLDLGDYKTAIDYCERYLKIAKELGDKSGEGSAYGKLGNAHQRLGDSKTATEYFKRVLKIAKEMEDKSAEGRSYGNLGVVQSGLGNFKRAIDYHERHLKIAKELADKSGEGKVYGNLGNAHLSLGNFKTAIDYHERQLIIQKELGDKSGEGRASSGLGNAHQSLGDYKTALDYHKRHLKIAKELGIKSEEGNAYGNLGNVHQNLGDYETAIDYFERNLKIAKKLGDKSGEGRAYGSLGNAHESLGDFKTAIDNHERYLKIANELGDKSGEGNAYGALGNAHQSLGDFKSAIDYHERHLKIAKELGDSIGIAKSLYSLGFCFECLGRVREAVDYYQCSVTKFNNIRDRLQFNDKWKIGLRHNYQIVYTSLWRSLLKQGKDMEALFAAEQGRAQALKDLLELCYAFETTDDGSGTEKETIHELLSCLSPNTIFMAIGEKEIIFWVCQKGKNVELRGKQISSRDAITYLQSLMQITGQEIGARDDVKCEDRSFDMTRDKKLADERSPPDNSQRQSLNLQKSALSTLYDTIIDPIQDLLLGSELVLVPQGPLCLAPFAALQDTNSKYLCESFRIRVIPSLTSLKLIVDCQADYHSKSGALLVGDPWVQEFTKLQQLPCAREEVEMIGRMLGSRPLIGRQATKDEVLRRLGSVALVHIAAHGSMETGEIALAPKTGEVDCILTMRDVLRVQMRARLVVLSCCHSARGEIKAEGVVGIARAFLGAGARSVLVSLWAIDDEATLEFMKSFYQHLVKGKSASEALNQAMNSMRESDEFSAVKYWAPFVLIGDDVTLEFGGSE